MARRNRFIRIAFTIDTVRIPKLDVTSSNLVARSFPRTASIHKVTLTRYVDKQGNRVPEGTKGARTIKEKSSKWHSM
jgi:hypothetical protein